MIASNSIQTAADAMSARRRAQLAEGAVILSLVLLAVSFALYATAPPRLLNLDWDAGLHWHNAISGQRSPPIVYAHHPLLHPLLRAAYLALQGGCSPLQIARTLYVACFGLLALMAYAAARCATNERTNAALAAAAITISPPMISHLRTFEDNLLGYPLLLAAMALLFAFFKEQKAPAHEGRPRSYSRVYLAALCCSIAHGMGSTYLGWTAAMGAAIGLYFAPENWKLALGAGLRFGAAFLLLSAGVLIATVDPLYSEYFGQAFLLTFASPYALYADLVRNSADLNGFEYIRDASALAISGLNPLTVSGSGYAFLVWAPMLALFGGVLNRLRQDFHAPRQRALLSFVLLAGGAHLAFLYTFREPNYMERTDWAPVWAGLGLVLLTTNRTWRWRLLWLCFAPGVWMHFVTHPGDGNLSRIHSLGARGGTVIFDATYFYTKGESTPGTFRHLSNLGAAELAAPPNCITISTNAQAFTPLQCPVRTDFAALTAAVLQQPDAYIASPQAAQRLGLTALEISCASFSETYAECGNDNFRLTPRQSATIRSEALNACHAKPALQDCLRINLSNCPSLTDCALRTLADGPQ